jgi:hypothetical protein
MTLKHLCTAALTICIFSLALVAAENPFVGTWKENMHKSKLSGPEGLTKVTVKYEVDGDTLKASVEGTDAQGKPASFTYEGKLDGTPGTVTGATTFDAIALQRLGTHSMKATGEKDGKLVYTDRRVVSQEGKTLTISRSGTDSQRKAYHSTMVFDKQ